MAEIIGGFNANDVPPDTGFEAIPADEYLVAIVESESKVTKDKKGSFLELKLVVLEGEYKDRNLWARLNLQNANEKAVTIARGQLSAICRAVGVLTPKDSVELHNIPLVVKVVVRKDNNDENTNEVKRFRAKGDGKTVTGKDGDEQKPWQRSYTTDNKKPF
jgi:hypothetical protein